MNNKSFLVSESPARKVILDRTLRTIEKLSEIIYFASVNVVPAGLLLPKAIVSYYKYFTTNASNDAFELPFPSWFVSLLSANKIIFEC